MVKPKPMEIRVEYKQKAQRLVNGKWVTMNFERAAPKKRAPRQPQLSDQEKLRIRSMYAALHEAQSKGKLFFNCSVQAFDEFSDRAETAAEKNLRHVTVRRLEKRLETMATDVSTLLRRLPAGIAPRSLVDRLLRQVKAARK